MDSVWCQVFSFIIWQLTFFSDIPDREARRALTLVAKVLQNLANFSSHFKEEFMQPLNPFLVKNTAKMSDFLDKISVPVEPLSVLPTISPPSPFRPMEVPKMHRGRQS